MNDPVNSPAHYTAIPAVCTCGRTLEPIDFTRHMGFNLGNAAKYILRAPYKGNPEEDLRKALFYINDELRKMRPEEPERVEPGDPAGIADGYNPDELTNAHVQEGWRLCRQGEAVDPNDHIWSMSKKRWQRVLSGSPDHIVGKGGLVGFTYRTTRPLPCSTAGKPSDSPPPA